MESRQSLEGIGSIHVGSRNVGSNEEHDPATNTWRECARMPRGLNHIGAVGLGGKVFCIGGFIEQSQTAAPDVSVYDPRTDSWQKLTPLPEPLGFNPQRLQSVCLSLLWHPLAGRGLVAGY